MTWLKLLTTRQADLRLLLQGPLPDDTDRAKAEGELAGVDFALACHAQRSVKARAEQSPRSAISERRKELEQRLSYANAVGTDVIAILALSAQLEEHAYFEKWLDARSVKPAQEAQP